MSSAQPTATETLELDPVQPFDFQQSLAFVDSFAPCAGDHRCTTDSLTTGGYAAGDPFAATVTAAEDSGAGRTLAVTVEWLAGPGGSSTDTGDATAVADHLRAHLSLDDDLGPLYAAADDDDPAFGSVVDDLYGYHHVRFPTPFEAACWAALSQRTPWQVAQSLKRSLVEAAGTVLERNDEEVALFPTPEGVLANESAVEAAIDHDRKRKTVLAAAEVFVSEDMDALSDDALRSRLAEVWGFGEWSSEFVTLRGFGRMGNLPRSERRLREAVADVYGLDEEAADDADLDRLSDSYSPLAGYWAHYLRVWEHRSDGDTGR